MKEFLGEVKNIYKAAEDVVVLEVKNRDNGEVFGFLPGQYAMISYRNKKGKFLPRKPFSIASSPAEKGFLQFGVKMVGKFTRGLADLKPGDEVRVWGPFGEFVFNESEKDVVQIAGGIGITPFISALRHVTDAGLDNRITLLYSNRTLSGAVFFDELQRIEAENSNLKNVFAVTSEIADPDMPGVENSFINKSLIKKHAGDLNGKFFYLCGPLKFMEAMEAHLKELGVSPRQIKKEEFSMAPAMSFGQSLRHHFASLSFSATLALLIFSFIYQPPPIYISGAEASTKRTYPEEKAAKINQAAYDRLAFIADTKKAALRTQKELALAKSSSSSSSKPPAQTVSPVLSEKSSAANLPAPVDAESLLNEFQQLNAALPKELMSAPVLPEISAPVPARVSAPAPAPAPAPRTTVS